MQLVQILPQLAKKGFEVSVFVTDCVGPLADELRSHNITVRHPAVLRIFKGLPFLFFKLMRLIHVSLYLLFFAFKHRKGILHFYLPQAVIFGGLLTVWWHPCVIISQRGLLTYRRKYPAFVTDLERFIFR